MARKRRVSLITAVNVRRTVQWLALFAFLAAFVMAQRGGWPPGVANLPMRLDPLAMLANLLSSRAFLAGSSLALITLLLTIAFGRSWCGWLCPLGTILDLLPLRGKKEKSILVSANWGRVKYSLLIIILTAALLGNLTLLFLDPLTILIRSLQTSIWPALDRILTTMETWLFPIPFMQAPLAWLDGRLRPGFLPQAPVYYRFAILYFALLVGLVVLNRLAPHFWCRYLCPLGALLGLTSKISLIRLKIDPECQQCGLCARICPTGAIRQGKHYAIDESECTRCLICMEDCPGASIKLTPVWKPASWDAFDPGRRQMLLAIGGAVAGVALLQSDISNWRDNPYLIQPPGAREQDLISRCVRCSECIRACPTGGLQPALLEAGLSGFWTPVLVPRNGYCDYACNACGQICPVEAIPPLDLETKRNQVIGLAFIDQNRCIAWSDHTDCIVCEEMCPLPEKAVLLDLAQVPSPDGTGLRQIQLPRVLRDRCIGCGICEYKCPVNGEAAIRVFVPGEASA